MFYKPPQTPGTRYFRFNPADYNTTWRIVKNLHYGKTTLMRNGDVIIEYDSYFQFISFFTQLPLHRITPEDIDPPVTPKEARNIRQTSLAEDLVLVLQVVCVGGSIIYMLYLLISGQA